jgi:hypothetical protein
MCSIYFAQKTQAVTIIFINMLMPFREIIGIYSENNMKPTYILCRLNAGLKYGITQKSVTRKKKAS